jgi:multiple sugar transport system permease protein
LIAIAVGALLLGVFWFGPLVLVAIASAVPSGALLTVPPRWFDSGFSVSNYNYIFTGTFPQSYLESGALRGMISQEVRQIPQAMANSLIVATAVMLINLVLGSVAAYAFARLRFPGRYSAFNFILISRLIPSVALAVPYYAIVQSAGLVDTHAALILIYAVLTLPFTVLILTLYFRGLPPEVEEAAQVDGASPIQVLLRIAIPLAAPSLVGTGLFAFMLAYSEFLFALLITSSASSHTLPVVLGTVSSNPDVSWGLLTSSIMVGITPTLVLVFPVWRLMVRDLTSGSVRQAQ